jgi:hypothetical protein
MTTNARIERLTREALGTPGPAFPAGSFTKNTLAMLAIVLLGACAIAVG